VRHGGKSTEARSQVSGSQVSGGVPIDANGAAPALDWGPTSDPDGFRLRAAKGIGERWGGQCWLRSVDGAQSDAVGNKRPVFVSALNAYLIAA
jgi:hypothetical protein